MNAPLPDTKVENDAGARAPKTNVIVRWHSRVLSFCLIIFALELGLFLVVYPWRREWALSWVPVHSPGLFALWMSRWFRGVVTGLGLLNIYVAASEVGRQVRSLLGEGRR